MIRLAVACLIAVVVHPAFAINKSNMSGFRYGISDSGKSASIRPNQSGSSGVMGAVGSVPAGQVGSQIGNTGWYIGASGSGNPSGRGTMNMGHTGEVYFAGAKYPFQAGYEVPKQRIVEAVGILCKNPLICMGLSVTAPAVIDWLAKGKVRINTNEADYPDKPFIIQGDKPGSSYRINDQSVPADTGWVSASVTACATYLQIRGGIEGPEFGFTNPSVVGDQCKFTMTRYGMHYANTSIPIAEKTSNGYEDLPASMDDIAPYMDTPDVPAQAVSQILDQGGEIQLPSAPTVTGPSQVQGPKQETSNPDGTKNVTQVTNNYTTQGNTITNTSTTTVNQKCTVAGSCSDVTTTTTTNPSDPEKPDDPATDTPLPDVPKLYERKYPDGMVGIWKDKKDQFKQTSLMTFVEQVMPTGFVAGSCPSWQIDLSLAQWAEMGSYQIEPPCWIWPVAKTILIVSALLLARSLIFGG